MPAVEVRDLTVRFGRFCAVNHISFDVDAGEVVTILGPNGAGKTTTIETIEGFRSPDEGSVRVLGADPVTDHKVLVNSVGVMLQGLGTYPQLSPSRALNLFASYYPNPRVPEDLLHLMGLEHVTRTPAKRLSGGERQRLALALALIGRPKVVFLDEPTSGIDPAGRIDVRSIIAGLKAEGVAVVLTTHELDEVERLADRVIIISEGSIVASGSLHDLMHTSDSVKFTTRDPVDVEALGIGLGLVVEAFGERQYRINAANTSAIVAPLSTWLAEHHHEILDLRAGGNSLEEIYLSVAVSPEGEADPERRRGRRGQRRGSR